MKLMTIFAVLLVLGFCFSGTFTPQPQPSEDDDPQYSMQVAISPSCDGNAVSVMAKGENLSGAHVSVKDVSNANLVAWGDTGADGTFVFNACGMKVDVKVTSEDYDSQVLTQQLVDCGQCGAPEPECTESGQCAAAAACVDGACEPIPCECGKVENHQCVRYACCSDSQCLSTQSCVDHSCVEKPPAEEGCSQDGDCTQTQYCAIPATHNTGSCEDVVDEGCGQILNHTFAAYGYECGTEKGCPSCQAGYECRNHKCVQNNVACPASGVVGASPACDASENGQPCANCDYVVTDPSGQNSTGRTDQNGTFTFPLNLPGTYRVALLKDGQAVKIIEVKSMPKAQGEETEKPTGASSDMTPIIVGVLLLLLLAGAILFWKSRAAKK
ncbi:carboxypeptidase-like regulatory domain-containing protein [Candidatus Micrarchaeota archaeon]|nr:carboxypeptidase-like regulatory domain-containing protein [Candidatus Micrarchaeota archaeon]